MDANFEKKYVYRVSQSIANFLTTYPAAYF